MVFNIIYKKELGANELALTDTDIYQVKDDRNEYYTEVHSIAILKNYSRFLLDNVDQAEEIIKDFTEITKLRTWLFERSNVNREHTEEKHYYAVDYVRKMLKDICSKYKNLSLNED